MNTKNTLAALLCLAGFCFAPSGHTAPPEPSAVGAWSPAADGVQGRLLVAVDGKINGTRMSRIYLELRNVSDSTNSQHVYYGSGEGLRLEVVDAKGRMVAPDQSSDFDAMVPEPADITLPHDSALRFLVSVPGHGIPKNAGMMLEFSTAGEAPVLLPAGSHTAYFLRGTFGGLFQHPLFQREWHGRLTLPPVQVPLQ